MPKLKAGTQDICESCGRTIEWNIPPEEYDDDGVLVHKYYQRHMHWVDVDPPGEDLWSPYCNFEDRITNHMPKNHCPVYTNSGDRCFAKVREPWVASDGTIHIWCRTHGKRELETYERRLRHQEEGQMDRWRNESVEHILHELKMRSIQTYPIDSMPLWKREELRAINSRELLLIIWRTEIDVRELQDEIVELKKEVQRVSEDKGVPEGQQGLVHLPV